MESKSLACPKCGGSMKQGEIKFEVEQYSSSSQNPFMAKSISSPLPGMYDRASSTPYWQEKTGKKTGFIIKTDEIQIMPLIGFRCSLCGFIEIYADVNKAET
jgi:hypothetical protein